MWYDLPEKIMRIAHGVWKKHLTEVVVMKNSPCFMRRIRNTPAKRNANPFACKRRYKGRISLQSNTYDEMSLDLPNLQNIMQGTWHTSLEDLLNKTPVWKLSSRYIPGIQVLWIKLTALPSQLRHTLPCSKNDFWGDSSFKISMLNKNILLLLLGLLCQ